MDVRLRLPTYFCAPNFAYLMAADAKEAILSVPGVEEVRVMLDDHHTADEINAGVNDERGFDGAFPGETEGPDLEGLRDIFRRKTFVARQQRLCRELLSSGYTPQDLARMRLGEVPLSGAEFEKYLERRQELGIETLSETPFLVDPDGQPIPQDVVVAHLRFARTVGVSIEGNAGLCRELLATRYGRA